ncbi:archaellin/type IV pilin N-terminal domain-containing protein [Halobaculum rubrum]|uniref:archaellin/type IV pilin N-terminal domain-containing protein n=1 Tax=Halobaculum rubrum TaxID=2872158 RepID=UPI001CA44588|nr:archaellin/type IV pilin N-terminal domain-containing protein [Halobaculum rubrum]QZX99007.1 flagellin [Halobaculum rubrum]
MFEFITDEEERGQVGIGTLIVFIAMVLVAAIAAGVLINTAGFLQSKSQETGQQSSKQVSNRLQEVATVGNVTGDPEKVDYVNVTVTQAPGAGEIDLQNATVTWIGPQGTYQLTHGANYSADGGGVAADTQEFGHKVTKDADNSAPVLNDPDDRLQLVFDVSAYTDNLGEGEEVTIKINTMAGATTSIRFTVPEALGQKEAVEL